MQKILVLPLMLCAVVAFAQTKQNAPYSRFGLGDPQPQAFANQLAMGGMTAAFHDPFHLNLVNPASYAFLRSTALETGLYSKYSSYKSSDASFDNWSGNLAYLALGFTLKSPINEVMDKKKTPWQMGMGLALTPTTLVGYNIQVNDTLPNLGALTNSFTGNGGSYQLTWSNAIKYKNTAIGLNLGWMFGKSTYESATNFHDSLPTYSDNFRDETSLRGLVWRAGIQHDLILKYADKEKETPERWLTFGISGAGNQKINIDNTSIRLRSRGKQDNGQYLTPDTLLYNQGETMKLTLPTTISAAVQYVNATKFKIGAEYAFEQGSAYNNPARADGTFRNGSSFSAGVEYTPDYTSYNHYGKRVRYRLGGYYRQDIRVVDGTGINNAGITLGAGFPIILPRQQTSFINTSLEIGQFGTGSAIKETYARLTLGFTLNDNSWFYKRRFE